MNQNEFESILYKFDEIDQHLQIQRQMIDKQLKYNQREKLKFIQQNQTQFYSNKNITIQNQNPSQGQYGGQLKKRSKSQLRQQVLTFKKDGFESESKFFNGHQAQRRRQSSKFELHHQPHISPLVMADWMQQRNFRGKQPNDDCDEEEPKAYKPPNN